MKSIFSGFFWRDSIRRLRGEKGKFLLSAGISFVLICCIAGYLGNISASRVALQHAGEAFPITLQVYSINGQHNQQLEIPKSTYQGLTDTGVKEAVYTAPGRVLNPGSDADPSTGARVCAANSMDALTENGGTAEFFDGYDASFLGGSSAVCLMTEEWMKSNDISPGDTVTYNLYAPRRDTRGMFFIFEDVGECSLTVVGTVSFTGFSQGNIIVPIKWLWGQEDSVGIENVCDSYHAVVADSLELNTFKEKVGKCGLGQINPYESDSYKGKALMMNDKRFIEYSEEMVKSIDLLEQYLIPFILLVFMMIAVLSFLIFRSDRRNMAIAISLGQPGTVCGLSYFVSILVADLLGAVLALIPVMILISDGLLILEIYLLFFLCVTIGVGACLFVLSRSDMWELLSRTD